MNDISQPVRITCVDLPFPPLLPSLSLTPSFLPSFLPSSISTSLLRIPYLPTSPSLPLLAYLIKLLEQHCCQLHWEPGFVTLMFYQIRVSYPSLFTLYNGCSMKRFTFICVMCYIHSFIHPLIYLPTHPFNHLFIHLSNHSPIHPSTHAPIIHLFIYIINIIIIHSILYL